MGIKPLLSASQIGDVVARLGEQISEDYAGKELTILGVLTGSLVFVADLMRTVPNPHRIGLLRASSYRGAATSPGELTVEVSLLPDVRDRDILLVDDILDTGKTLSAIIQKLQEMHPRSIRSAVLLWKKERTIVDIHPDYVGFEISDAFVVGYGLDHDDRYRHLPYIGVLEDVGE